MSASFEPVPKSRVTMIRTLINSEPDIERDFEAVINVGVAVGAGETCEVYAALQWSLVDRRTDDTLPHLDRHWQRTANSPESIETKKYGHGLRILLETCKVLRATEDWERKDLYAQRHHDVRRALDIVEQAIAVARRTHDYMASVPPQLTFEKTEKDS